MLSRYLPLYYTPGSNQLLTGDQDIKSSQQGVGLVKLCYRLSGLA